MVGQREPLPPTPANQIEEEMTRVAKVEIARAVRLVRNVGNAAGKKHMSPRDQRHGSVDSDDKAWDGVDSGGHHPKFDRHRPVDREAWSGSEHEVDHSGRNSAESSGKACSCTTRQLTMM
jgi:hypothetical protein